MVRRVFVTGLGVISPVGTGVDEFWSSLCSGRSGIDEIRAFDTIGFDTKRGGEVRGFDPRPYFKRVDQTKVARTTQFAVAVARMAWDGAGLEIAKGEATDRSVGICFGTTMGNQSVVEAWNDTWIRQKAHAIPAEAYPASQIAAVVAEELNVSGPAAVVPTACAAGNYALGMGLDLIRAGRAEVVIAGGSDALSRGCYALFNRLAAISPDLCRPFDRNRRGMQVSEGAAALVLESERHLRARGREPLAELLGYGLACDAHHPTAPHPEGLGAMASMERALANSALAPSAVSYISAHGTGTRANDSTESLAVRRLFRELTDRVPVSSIKSTLGHTMGAASAIEAVASVLAIQHGILPPTMNFTEPDPECLQNVVPNQAVSARVDVVLSNAFGFGGNIATVVLSRPGWAGGDVS